MCVVATVWRTETSHSEERGPLLGFGGIARAGQSGHPIIDNRNILQK